MLVYVASEAIAEIAMQEADQLIVLLLTRPRNFSHRSHGVPDRSEKIASLIPLALIAPCHAHRGAQSPRTLARSGALMASVTENGSAHTPCSASRRHDGRHAARRSMPTTCCCGVAASRPDTGSQHTLRGHRRLHGDSTIGELLGHTRRGVTARHYIRRPNATLIAAADRICSRVSAALDGKSGKVIELRKV